MSTATGGLELLRRAAERIGRVDAELLLSHLVGRSRAELYLDPPAEAPEGFAELVEQRVAGEPLQYLTGWQAFRSHRLAVGPGVLVPRPETELLVEAALGLLPPGGEAVDVGTGSGAIALSLAVERPDAKVWATELSDPALSWARRNLAGLPNVELRRGDLLAPLPDWLQADLVVSNPPYLSQREWAEAPDDVRLHEPKEALTCGGDGFAVTGRLIDAAWRGLAPAGWLVVETSPGLAGRVAGEMSSYREVEVLKDLAGRPRIVKGRKP